MVTTKKSRAVSGARTAFWFAALLAGCTPAGPRALLEGDRQLRDGKFAEAIAPLTRATEKLPKEARAWNHLGLAFHHAGRAEDAARAYRQALALDRNLLAARFNLGCLLLEQNNSAAAQELATVTVLDAKSAEAWTRRGTAELRAALALGGAAKLKALDQAEKSFRQATNLNARVLEALNGLGVAQAHRGRALEAVQSFDAAVQLRRDYPPALFNLAVASHLLPTRPKDYRLFALQKYQEYLALQPRPANWQSVDAVARQLELELAPPKATATDAPPPVGTNVLAVMTNRPPRAATNELARNTLPIEMAKTPPATNSIQGQPPSGAAKPTAVDSVKVSEPPPVKPAATAAAAPSASASKTPETKAARPVAQPVPTAKSTGDGRRYAYRSPAKPATGNKRAAEWYALLGRQARQEGRGAEAMESFQKAAQSDPASFEAQFNVGLLAQEASDLPTALSVYEVALAIDPASVSARFNFALALQSANFPRDAANELEKLLSEHPGEARAHLLLASLCAQQLNQKPQAREHYQRVLDLEPQHTQATAIRYWLKDNP
jgi:tetratricopeptide (TPR) repeat protein